MQSYCTHTKKDKKKEKKKERKRETENKKSPGEVIYHIAWAGVFENWYH